MEIRGEAASKKRQDKPGGLACPGEEAVAVPGATGGEIQKGEARQGGLKPGWLHDKPFD